MDALENFGEAFKDLGGGIVETVTDLFKTAGAGGVTSGQFTVNPGNVLAAGKIIDAQADELQDKYLPRLGGLYIDPPGHDRISDRMATAWNDLIVGNDDSYANRVRQYVESLRRLVTQIEEAAKTYGYTDDQIASALGKKRA
jgi:hypothetical protein